MPLPQRKEYTIEDIYSLSEGTRAELIDGQIYYMVRQPEGIKGFFYPSVTLLLIISTKKAVPVKLILHHLQYF